MSADAWRIAVARDDRREGRSWRCRCLVHGSCSLGLLNGARVVMRAEDAVAIETTTGARQTWRHKPTETGQVLAWELADAERR